MISAGYPKSLEVPMLSPWIAPEALASLDQGFVVAIMLEAKPGHADALAEFCGYSRRQPWPNRA